MPMTAPIKQRDSILFYCRYAENGDPVDITHYEIRSQVRASNGSLVDSMTVAPLNQTTHPGQFTLAATHEWPVGRHVCDVVFSANGQVRTTETFEIQIIDRVTE